MGAHIKEVIRSLKLWERLQEELSEDPRQLCRLGKFPQRSWFNKKDLKSLIKRSRDFEFTHFAFELLKEMEG